MHHHSANIKNKLFDLVSHREAVESWKDISIPNLSTHLQTGMQAAIEFFMIDDLVEPDQIIETLLSKNSLVGELSMIYRRTNSGLLMIFRGLRIHAAHEYGFASLERQFDIRFPKAFVNGPLTILVVPKGGIMVALFEEWPNA